MTSTAPGRYQPVLATLAFVHDLETDEVLLVHRIAKDGKHNGLGGKLEPREDIVEGCRRELEEEAGLELTDLSLRGTVSWDGFDDDGTGWFGFIFLVTGWSGRPPTANDEGTLAWVPRQRILDWCEPATRLASGLDFHEGDAHFLPLVFDGGPAFHAAMPWHGGRPIGWSVTRLT